MNECKYCGRKTDLEYCDERCSNNEYYRNKDWVEEGFGDCDFECRDNRPQTCAFCPVCVHNPKFKMKYVPRTHSWVKRKAAG